MTNANIGLRSTMIEFMDYISCQLPSFGSGSRYINIIYCKTYFSLCYGGAVTDQPWLALSVSLPTVVVAGWRCQYLAVH